MDDDDQGRYDRHTWHLESLRALGFNRQQREALIDQLDSGEIDLADLRALIEKRHWTPEQVFLSAA